MVRTHTLSVNYSYFIYFGFYYKIEGEVRVQQPIIFGVLKSDEVLDTTVLQINQHILSLHYWSNNCVFIITCIDLRLYLIDEVFDIFRELIPWYIPKKVFFAWCLWKHHSLFSDLRVVVFADYLFNFGPYPIFHCWLLHYLINIFYIVCYIFFRSLRLQTSGFSFGVFSLSIPTFTFQSLLCLHLFLNIDGTSCWEFRIHYYKALWDTASSWIFPCSILSYFILETHKTSSPFGSCIIFFWNEFEILYLSQIRQRVVLKVFFYLNPLLIIIFSW